MAISPSTVPAWKPSALPEPADTPGIVGTGSSCSGAGEGGNFGRGADRLPSPSVPPWPRTSAAPTSATHCLPTVWVTEHPPAGRSKTHASSDPFSNFHRSATMAPVHDPSSMPWPTDTTVASSSAEPGTAGLRSSALAVVG